MVHPTPFALSALGLTDTRCTVATPSSFTTPKKKLSLIETLGESSLLAPVQQSALPGNSEVAIPSTTESRSIYALYAESPITARSAALEHKGVPRQKLLLMADEWEQALSRFGLLLLYSIPFLILFAMAPMLGYALFLTPTTLQTPHPSTKTLIFLNLSCSMSSIAIVSMDLSPDAKSSVSSVLLFRLLLYPSCLNLTRIRRNFDLSTTFQILSNRSSFVFPFFSYLLHQLLD